MSSWAEGDTSATQTEQQLICGYVTTLMMGRRRVMDELEIALTLDDVKIWMTRMTFTQRLSYDAALDKDVNRMAMWQGDRRNWDDPRTSADRDMAGR